MCAFFSRSRAARHTSIGRMRRARLSLHVDPCVRCGSLPGCDHCRCPGYDGCAHAAGAPCGSAVSRSRLCHPCRVRKECEPACGGAESLVCHADMRALDQLAKKIRPGYVPRGGKKVDSELTEAFHACLASDCAHTFSEYVRDCLPTSATDDVDAYVRRVAAKGEYHLLSLADALLTCHHANAAHAARAVVRELEGVSCPLHVIKVLRMHFDQRHT